MALTRSSPNTPLQYAAIARELVLQLINLVVPNCAIASRKPYGGKRTFDCYLSNLSEIGIIRAVCCQLPADAYRHCLSFEGTAFMALSCCLICCLCLYCSLDILFDSCDLNIGCLQLSQFTVIFFRGMLSSNMVL